MFRKVLIANRGEIAIRIATTLQQMGIRAVAVFSDADAKALHVEHADEAYELEGRTSAETYLRMDKILDAAIRSGADAIHPGFGFLSENPAFAQACKDAGLVFIGPTPEAMRSAGDKITAKKAADQSHVPTVPGWSGAIEELNREAPAQARRIGYPVLIKAAAGGGGKGMRVVASEGELAAALESAQREAAAAFGDHRVFLEKYVTRPRHIEFQVLGDHHGNIVHLFERECSIQRRHQKLLEESPSSALTLELRTKMGEAAVRLAKSIGYTNAGTVEFILDDKGNYYFLEINARLQVEHPVTEWLLRQDLVAAQVRIAAGAPLPFKQDELRPLGHAVECRICAEDPERGFMPSTGTIVAYAPPVGPYIRVDSGIDLGSEVSVYYDPMLAKLIVWGADRDEALNRMSWALRRFVILGVTTNIEFLQRLVEHPDLRAGRLHTHFLQEHDVMAGSLGPISAAEWIGAAVTVQAGARSPGRAEAQSATVGVGPWQSGPWRNG